MLVPREYHMENATSQGLIAELLLFQFYMYMQQANSLISFIWPTCI